SHKMWETVPVETLDSTASREAQSEPRNHTRVISPQEIDRLSTAAPSPRHEEADVATKERDITGGRGLTSQRYFTRDGVHPFDEVEWEIRDAIIPNYKEGGNAFEQRGVEFPKEWSQNATNIVAQKYFRGPLDTPERESSVRQMIGRVVDTITGWGVKDGYFATDADARTFSDELTHLLVTQKAAFNSPVWFNVGHEEKPQCSAC